MPGSILKTLIPPRAVMILLDVDERRAYERKRDIPSVAYLASRRKRYLALTQYSRFELVDENKDRDEIHREIVRRVYKNQTITGPRT